MRGPAVVMAAVPVVTGLPGRPLWVASASMRVVCVSGVRLGGPARRAVVRQV
ncbi:hypothetical protein ACFFSW_00225 [Saccharothrix longispora]|uniref:Uncharacterized protein n=1 Tax=Saccharothrix longispora TaxID=33920 RepID=A0ABU1PUT5_9PSEU|nr:hypothetical protein [Saccharothrix longispora]MDR6594408.1 hypothetical protein [Saccharothrix longispora]